MSFDICLDLPKSEQNNNQAAGPCRCACPRQSRHGPWTARWWSPAPRIAPRLLQQREGSKELSLDSSLEMAAIFYLTQSNYIMHKWTGFQFPDFREGSVHIAGEPVLKTTGGRYVSGFGALQFKNIWSVTTTTPEVLTFQPTEQLKRTRGSSTIAWNLVGEVPYTCGSQKQTTRQCQKRVTMLFFK